MSNEIQTLKFGSVASPVAPLSGTYDLTYGELSATNIDFDRTASEVQTLLEGLLSIGEGNILVQSVSNGFTFEFRDDLANTNVPLITANSNLFQAAGNAPSITETQAGVGDSSNSTNIDNVFNDGDESNPASQVLTFSPIPNEGTWQLDGNSVGIYDTPSVSGWNVSGSAASGTVTLTYQSNGSGISPVSYSNVSLAQFTAGQPQIYSLTPSSDATAGEIDLTIDFSLGYVSGQFSNNASTSTVQTAVGGTFNVSGSDGGPWTLTSSSNGSANAPASAVSYSANPLRKSLGIEIVETQAGAAEEPEPEPARARSLCVMISYEEAEKLGLI